MARSGSSSKRSSLYADLENLRTQFSSLDPTNTGYIGYEELKTLAQSESGLDEAMVPELLERLDRDKDGKVCFEDLQALFESEREAIKKQKLEDQRRHPEGLISASTFTDVSRSSQEYDSAVDTTAEEIVVSPPPDQEQNSTFYQTAPVVLRHKKKKSHRLINHEQYPGNNVGFSTLSPIPSVGAPATDDCSPDLATQMRYLTNIPESPRLNRRSKVLSWISESEDMFEDTGAGREQTDGILSPPMSPVRVSGDEATHICSTLESVCHTENIGKDAVRQLCSHVQADQHEEQELLTLVDHLDKEGKGFVSIDEFVHGLQSIRTSACVANFTPPPLRAIGRQKNYSDKPPPRLSEPFSSTPNSTKRTKAHYSFTPLPPPQNSAVYGDKPQLTVLDPSNSGFVAVETLAQQWQRMGVEAPQNQSLEEALRESLPVDASRRVSVSEVTTSLETAVLNEDKNQPTLRQAALLTYKGEINQLRSQLHQVSMERDGLRSNLHRNAEESKRLVQEGDEQVERITKELERIARENEQRLNDRLREVEREREDEAKRLQELLDRQSEKHRREVKELKCNEERLKMDLKLAHDEAKRRDHLQTELEGGRRSDRPDRLEVERNYGDGIKTSIEELEQGNAELLEQNKYLQERNTELQDKVDELFAENERMQHKHTSQRRKLQRHESEPRRLKSAPHSASQLDSRRISRPHSGKKRPSSATRRSTTPSSLPYISETPKDHDTDSDTLSPTVSPEPISGLEDGSEEVHVDINKECSDTSSSDDGLFAKSTASLMDELQYEDRKADLEEELAQLRRENQELEESCRILEQQLMHQQDQSNCEKKRLLHARRLRQEDLERRIRILEDHNRRLSNAKKEIDTQLANTEDSLARQLDDIHRLRDTLCTAALTPADIDVGQTSVDFGVSREMQTSPPELEEMEPELSASTAERNQQIVVHKREIDRMKSEALDEKRRLLAREDELNKTIMRLGKELQSSQLALEQYKSDAQSLDIQLQKSRQELSSKDWELRLLQGRPQRRVLPTQPTKLLNAEETPRLRENSQNGKKAELEQGKESECQSLRSQEAKYETQLKQQEYKYQNQLAKTKEDADKELLAFQTKMKKEIHETKMRCEIQVEGVQQQLKATQLTITHMKGKLESAEKQCEKLLLDNAQQKHTVAQQTSQIGELQETKVKLEEEMLHTQEGIQRQEMRLLQQVEVEQQLRSQLEHLQSQLILSQVEQGMPVVKLAMEEVDYPVEALAPASDVTSPSRHSYQSDRSYQEEIVTQMKSQLEDLQMCLIQQHSPSSKSNELTLVQELIETNAALQADLEGEQTGRQKELEVLAVKDSEIQSLAGQTEKHNLELVQLERAVLGRLKEALKSLQQTMDPSLENSSCIVEAASNAIEQLIELMHAKQDHPASTSEAWRAKCTTSHNSYRHEAEQYHSTLDYHGEESGLEQGLKHPQSIKQVTVLEKIGTLQSKPDQDHTTTFPQKMISRVIEEEEEEQREGRENERTSEIEEEAKKAKQQQGESKKVAEAVQRKMQRKEEEIDLLNMQTHAKEQEIADLKRKLQTVVNEPVEAVIQYVETAPLESVGGALLTSMQEDLHAAHEQRRQLEVQHEAEVKKMKKKIDQCMCESEELQQQVYALKQAVQEQEAELRSTMEKREAEKREIQLQNRQNHSRAIEQELHLAKSEADTLRSQLRDVCCQLVSVPLEKINYHDLVQRTQSEIASLLRQLSEEQTLRHELEQIIGKRQTEWQVQENAWQTEHEEEVRALTQRNSQLSKILEDTRLQYQEYIEEQERENSEIFEDLINKQAGLEKELEQRSHDPSSGVGDADGYSKEVLLDIIHQLCMELKNPLNVT